MNQWGKDFLFDAFFLFFKWSTHSFLKCSLLILPRAKTKKLVFKLCLMKSLSSVMVSGRLLRERSGEPGPALLVLLAPARPPLSSLKWWQFTYNCVFLKFHCFKKCPNAITLGNWCYGTQKHKSFLFEESFWIVHISKRWSTWPPSWVSTTSTALFGMLGIFVVVLTKQVSALEKAFVIKITL